MNLTKHVTSCCTPFACFVILINFPQWYKSNNQWIQLQKRNTTRVYRLTFSCWVLLFLFGTVSGRGCDPPPAVSPRRYPVQLKGKYELFSNNQGCTWYPATNESTFHEFLKVFFIWEDIHLYIWLNHHRSWTKHCSQHSFSFSTKWKSLVFTSFMWTLFRIQS